MANIKISDLTAAAAAASTNELEINEAGVSKKLTVEQVATYVESNFDTATVVAPQVTYENLNANSDVGTGATQVAAGNHTHTSSTISSLDAGDTTTGTFATARIPSLDASKITTGTVATARLGSGTASTSTFLRGDSSWQTISTTPPTTFGAVGTYGWFYFNTTTGVAVGSTASGSVLKYYTGASYSGPYWDGSTAVAWAGGTSASPSGTWRNMGIGTADVISSYRVLNLWVRIS